MPNRIVQWAAATALIVCLVGAAVAQQVPNAGSILRQLEPEQPNLPLPKADSSRSSAPAAASGPAIHVRAFRIDGNRLLPTAQIKLRVAGEYAPERIADAQRALEAGGLRGRAVILF